MNHRILYVIDTLRPLGDAFQLNLLMAEIASEYEIHVAVTGQTESDFNPLAGSLAKVHFLKPTAASGVRPVSDVIASAWRLKNLAGSVRPTIVHAWGANAEQIIGVATALKSHSLNSAAIVCTHLNQLPKTSFLTGQMAKLYRQRTAKVVVPHQSSKETLEEAGYVASQIEVVPNAAASNSRVDGRERLLKRIGLFGTHEQPLVIAGTAAHLVPVSRIKDLIWATDLLNCIRDDFHFVIFGEGQGRAALERFTNFTEAQSHVHFVSDSDALLMFSALDVYWHSHLQSPLPSPLLLAMANGVPSISVYGDGTREAIAHQETSMAVNFGARDEFARWTKFLIEKPESAKQLAEQGQSFVAKKFPVQEMVAGYESVYGSIGR